jgi:uncharacterized protein with PIN domain
MLNKNTAAKVKHKKAANTCRKECPYCGATMRRVIGERADLSYGEYLECPECKETI